MEGTREQPRVPGSVGQLSLGKRVDGAPLAGEWRTGQI